MDKPLQINRVVSTRLPTGEGDFQLCLYHNNRDDKEHLALVMGEVVGLESVPVRIHSECFTGDVLGSRRCDCGEQLQNAMQYIAAQGYGVIVYLRQEGRGIGLLEKLRAYNLQDQGLDTVEANLALGHPEDEREYSMAAAILADLGVASVKLLTNNPDKIQDLEARGITVSERIPLAPTVYADNAAYLWTKMNRMHHLFDLDLFTAPVEAQEANGQRA